jgi:ribosomal protein S18 acetylase RimI-like enzyme
MPHVRLLPSAEYARALPFALRAPLVDALLVADLTQLADVCLAVVAEQDREIVGLATLVEHLPFPAVALRAPDATTLQAMLEQLTQADPRMRQRSTWCLAHADTLAQLQQVAYVLQAEEECKMTVDWADLVSPTLSAETTPLGPADQSAIEALFTASPTMAWTTRFLGVCPCRGIYRDGMLVAIASTHFCTPWVAEVGSISTHPAYRRRGFAAACVHNVVADLRGQTEHVFLMVFVTNEPAVALYRKLGFREHERMWLTEFQL